MKTLRLLFDDSGIGHMAWDAINLRNFLCELLLYE